MEFGKNPIIVADRDYFPLLFSLRTSRPDLAFKLLTPDELIDRLTFSYRGNVIKTLLPLGLDYVKAKKYLRLLRLIPDAPELKVYRDALPEGGMEKDPLGDYELSQGDVYLLEMPEDIELHSLSKKNGHPFQDISLRDLGLEPVLKEGEAPKVMLFQNKYAQFSYLFSSLRKRMVQEGLDPSGVRIHVKDDGDAFYLRLLGELYGIKVDVCLSRPLFAKHDISLLVSSLHRRGSLILKEEEKTTPEGGIIAGIIDEYALDKIPFPIGYASLVEILQAKKETEERGGAGINASSAFAFTPNQEVYLTCFQNGPFHNVYADEDVFDDKTLVALGVNPSYVKTQLEKRKKWNYLSYHRFALISRVKEHLDEKIYDSQFFEERKWKYVMGPDTETPVGLYTSKAAKAFHMGVYDHHFVTAPQGEFHSYDSSFKKIDGYKVEKGHWSITNLEKYVDCPYRYYLSTVLPQASYDMRPAFAGSMIHAALEGIFDPGYDLEQAIAKGRIVYDEAREKEKEPALPYDEICKDLTAGNLRVYARLIREQAEHAKVLSSQSEYRVQWTYKDEGGAYVFYGSVDSIVEVGDATHRYYYVNDFKTGLEKFRAYEAFLGRSTQLPSYVYALRNGVYQKDKGGLFAGMGVKTVAFPKFSSCFNKGGVFTLKQGRKNLATHGVFLQDEAFWEMADDTAFSEKKGAKKNDPPIRVCNAKGDYLDPGKATFGSDGSGSLSMMPNGRPYSLDELLEDTEKACLEAIHKIEKGEFPIAPTMDDLSKKVDAQNLTCRYCAFKDVCYRNLSRDKKDLSLTVAKHFASEEKEEDDGVQ